MAGVQQAWGRVAPGTLAGVWGRQEVGGTAGGLLPAEAIASRLASGNGLGCASSPLHVERGRKQLQPLGASNKSAFLGRGYQRRWSSSVAGASSDPVYWQHCRASSSCSCSNKPLSQHLALRISWLPSSSSGRWGQHPQDSRHVFVRAEGPGAERPADEGPSTSITEPPQTSDSATEGDPNEPEERYNKGPYPNPYPILDRELMPWQMPKRKVLPGYEVHYHEDGRRFTEEEEEEFELRRKMAVVGDQYEEYERKCAEAFARGDFAPIPPPRMMRLPAKIGTLVQKAQDGIEYLVPDANVYDPGISLEDALENMREAVGYHDYYKQGMITVKGTQELFKLPGEYTWIYEVRKGRFYEQWKNPKISASLGWNGNPKEKVWDINPQGKMRLLDLDDLEVVHLAHWVRSGFYLNRSLEGKRLLSVSIPNYEPEPGEFLLRIRMTKKLVKGTIVVDRETWLPKRLTMKVFGACEEVWHFNEWRRVKPDLACLHPVEVIKEHVGSAGTATLRVESFETRPPLSFDEESEDLPWDKPFIPFRLASPEDPAPLQQSEWIGDDSVKIQMIRTESGHNLVRPLIDGQNLGLYVLDTGASMMTITKEAASQLEMDRFGEINVVTATGEFPAPFRRGRTWQLGPVKINEPLFLEVDHLADVITGYDPALGPIVGAVGHDLFFSATVHLRLTDVGTAEAGIELQRPGTYKPDPEEANTLEPLMMVGGCPVAHASVGRYNDLFLVDTGAGGVDVIFNKRGVAKYDLLNVRRRRGNMRIKGVSPFPGQENGAVRLFSAEVPFILGGYAFKKPKQALLCIEENMFDLSEYVVGIICGEMLEGSRIVFDYLRDRWGIIRDPNAGEEKAAYDYEFVNDWETMFGHNEELLKPLSNVLHDNPVHGP